MMKPKHQIVRSRSKGPLPEVQFVDLSNAALTSVAGITSCKKLQVVNLQNNFIYYLNGLDKCANLWHIDLSCNKLCSLDGLSRFVALGTLILNNNQLSWRELPKLQQTEILNLSLQGNSALDNDEHYRIQIVDALPKVWVLDGCLITSAERYQVEQFFAASAFSDKPVRRKVKRDNFIPSFNKNLIVTGVHGERTAHWRVKFPINGPMNESADVRRIMYLAQDLQFDLALQCQHCEGDFAVVVQNPNFMEELLAIRREEKIQTHMVLVLLIASLQFSFPLRLMERTLKLTMLDKLGSMTVLDLFLLPKEARFEIVSQLTSAILVDKDLGEESGIYEELYISMYNSVIDLSKLVHGGRGPESVHYMYKKKYLGKCLIASEVVQLMTIVPDFFEFLQKKDSVRSWVELAAIDKAHVDAVINILRDPTKDTIEAYKAASDILNEAVHFNTIQLTSRRSAWQTQTNNFLLNVAHCREKRPLPDPLYFANFHERGITPPPRIAANLKSGAVERRRYRPIACIGELVLVGPQTVAKIIAIPEPNVCLVQMDALPNETGGMVFDKKNPEKHFQYVDCEQLKWDEEFRFWKFRGSVGDRITISTPNPVRPQANASHILPAIAYHDNASQLTETARSQAGTRAEDKARGPLITYQGQVDEPRGLDPHTGLTGAVPRQGRGEGVEETQRGSGLLEHSEEPFGLQFTMPDQWTVPSPAQRIEIPQSVSPTGGTHSSSAQLNEGEMSPAQTEFRLKSTGSTDPQIREVLQNAERQVASATSSPAFLTQQSEDVDQESKPINTEKPRSPSPGTLPFRSLSTVIKERLMQHSPNSSNLLSEHLLSTGALKGSLKDLYSESASRDRCAITDLTKDRARPHSARPARSPHFKKHVRTHDNCKPVLSDVADGEYQLIYRAGSSGTSMIYNSTSTSRRSSLASGYDIELLRLISLSKSPSGPTLATAPNSAKSSILSLELPQEINAASRVKVQSQLGNLLSPTQSKPNEQRSESPSVSPPKPTSPTPTDVVIPTDMPTSEQKTEEATQSPAKTRASKKKDSKSILINKGFKEPALIISGNRSPQIMVTKETSMPIKEVHWPLDSDGYDVDSPRQDVDKGKSKKKQAFIMHQALIGSPRGSLTGPPPPTEMTTAVYAARPISKPGARIPRAAKMLKTSTPSSMTYDFLQAQSDMTDMHIVNSPITYSTYNSPLVYGKARMPYSHQHPHIQSQVSMKMTQVSPHRTPRRTGYVHHDKRFELTPALVKHVALATAERKRSLEGDHRQPDKLHKFIFPTLK